MSASGVPACRGLLAPYSRAANRPDLAKFYRAAAAQPVSRHHREQLEEARSYAYGGCVIQDIGYYPFGDPFASDLTHYVRSGDFIVHLFRDAKDANQLAFAVGALSHYIGDNIGHSMAVNRAVPVEFPKLGAKYGPVVAYAQDRHAHVQTEFAFDINEIAHHRFAPVHYLRHVGLNVPTQQLAAAYYETYGLE